MPQLESEFELDDCYLEGDSDGEPVLRESNREALLRNGAKRNREIRHAIEARREQKRIDRDLDAFLLETDNR